MNQKPKTTSGTAIVFVVAIVVGVHIALISSGTVRNPFVAPVNKQPATIEQALHELQATLHSIQSTPISQSSTKVEKLTSQPDQDAFLTMQQQIDATFDAQTLEYRLHRLRNDLVPELERLEREVLATSPREGLTPVDGKLSQMRIIGDLRREMSDKIALLERQRAALR